MAKAEAALQEDDQDDELLLDDQSDDDDQNQDDQDDDQTDDDQLEADDEQEDEGEEIVFDGDAGSHPQDDQRGIRKRINKLNTKVAVAEAGKSESEEALEIERERNRLLQLALDEKNQGQSPDAPPDPNDFDDGVTDPAFIEAYQDHIAKGVSEKLSKQQMAAQKTTETDSQLQARQVAHYKKADQLKVKDYDETEDIAIAALGQDVVNQMISSSEKSPEILYYLGKNPTVAEEVAELIKTNPVKGVLRIGALEARLVKRPVAQNRSAPDPDRELSGGGSGQKRKQRGPAGATFE